MEGFSVKIKETSKELSAREKIRIKDTGNAIKLDEATAGAPVVIAVDMYAVLEIHNEKSDNKDYLNYVIVDKGGNKFVTGSESFWTSFKDIVDEMMDAGEEDFEIEVYRKDSKNYKGKQFITCSIV